MFLLIFPNEIFGQEQKIKHNPKAVALNAKAGKLLSLANDWDVEIHRNALKFLDGATDIEPNYVSAYSNKLNSLLILNQNERAISTAKRIVLINPKDFISYIKLGVVYESLKNKSSANSNYKKAFEVAAHRQKEKGRISPYYDQTVVYALLFYKGKKIALKHLDSITQFYTKENDLKQNDRLRNIITAENYDLDSKKKIFNYFSVR
ncbi:hypothetical protein QWY86_02980 [Pedobacter aquatilis]|uniref:hypothetical protein n=1 Tax=Pedobacter aquatilis TaxID=351343 RepID=UPI0025B32FDC|nr:hypothetical protein [Pedobacter aquatilis]MDN3585615.1 hypothetical protein [Pedobacter aquatilis]